MIKLIIRHCLPWGNFATQAIQIGEDADVSVLQDKIVEKFGIVKSQQILKVKRDGITMRLVKGWSLDFYEIKEKTVVYLEKHDSQHHNEEEEEEEFKQSSYMNRGGYLAKLGIGKIAEEDEDDDGLATTDPSMKNQSPYGTNLGSDANSDTQHISDEEGGNHAKEQSEKGQKFAKIRTEKKNLLKEVKENNLEKIREIFKLFEGERNKEANIKKLINQIGETGWDSLHWAVYNGYVQIVKEFFSYGADVNAETVDGWTPLQLAVHKNHLEVAKLILSQKGVEVNEVTSKGTALHIAAKNGKADIVSLLIEQGADVRIKNEQDVLPLEVAANDKVKKIIEAAAAKKAEEFFKPPRPPIVKGFLFKRGTYLMQLHQRYMVMDPDEGTLIRYKFKEDYPDKPKEIIPLKNIEGARRMKAGPLSDKKYHYIQLFYQKRYLLACYNEETANKWVTYILQGIVYANYIDAQMKGQNHPNGPSTEEDKEINYFEEASEVIELEDQPPAPTSVDKAAPKPKNNKKEKPADPSVELNANGQERVNFKSFEVVCVLGSGAFGRVYKVIKKDTGKVYAMKALKKRNLILKNQLRYAVTEANVLKIAKHPFVLELHYAFQTPQHLYLVLDYCPGGDLSLHLVNKGTFTEAETRFYLAELILAMEYLHSKDVIYRDLKPENILVDQDGHIKLADFGLAKEKVTDTDVAKSFCGSPAYLSPEMVKRRGVGKAADIYGIGTVMYEMLTGESPYYNDDIPKLYQNIARAKLVIPSSLSDEAKNLVIRLLDREPENRPGVKDRSDLRNHPFFASIDWEKLERKEIPPPKLEPLDDDFADSPVVSKGQVFDTDYTEKNKRVNRVKAFTFVREQP